MSQKHSAIDPPEIAEHQCETQGCELLAKALVKKSDDIDVCTDFFRGVCGPKNESANYEFPGKEFVSESARILEIEEDIFTTKLLELIEPDRPENLTDSEIQMSKFFDSCVRRDGSGKDARDFFLHLLHDIGIPMGFSKERQSLSMFSALVRLSLIWGIDNPLLFIDLRPMRATGHYVTVIRTMQKNFYFEKIDATVLRRQRAVRGIADLENVREYFGHILRENRKWLSSDEALNDVARHKIRTVKIIFSDRYALRERDLKEMILNYVAVNEFLEWRQGNTTNAPGSAPRRTYRFTDFEEETDIKWRRAITYGVRQHVKFSLDSLVHAEAAHISRDTAHLLLDPRFHRAFRHYLYVWLLTEFRPWMGSEAEEHACREEGSKEDCAYLETNEYRLERFCCRKVSQEVAANDHTGFARIRYFVFS